MLNKIVGALGQVAEAGGSIVGVRSGTEEPPFTVERTVGGVEIRRYEPRIAAETTIDADEEKARNEGFRRLAGYIFGGNTTKTKIAMTAPVSQQSSEKIDGINKRVYKIKVVSWNSFRIGDTRNFTEYKSNGLCKNIKIKI